MIEKIKIIVNKIIGDTIYGQIGNFTLSFITPQASNFILGEAYDVETYLDIKFDQNKFLLFGFLDSVSKELFLNLITVSGVGCKTACAIIANNNINDLTKNIIDKNITKLCNMNKINSKMANKLVTELSNKLSKNKLFNTLNHQPTNNESLYNILLKIGFTKHQIGKVTNLDSNVPINEQIILAIKQING